MARMSLRGLAGNKVVKVVSINRLSVIDDDLLPVVPYYFLEMVQM